MAEVKKLVRIEACEYQNYGLDTITWYIVRA